MKSKNNGGGTELGYEVGDFPTSIAIPRGDIFLKKPHIYIVICRRSNDRSFETTNQNFVKQLHTSQQKDRMD